MYAAFIVIFSIALLSFLIMKCKIHAFFSLIITAVSVGLLSGLTLADSIALTTTKLGGSISNIAVVIGLAVVSGQLMDESGAAEKIARSILKLTGNDKAPLAMVGTGYVLSIPLFSDTCYYLMIPIARALSLSGGGSFVAMVVAMGCGALATHCFVPPTPGPLAMAETLGVDLGLTMLVGMVIAAFSALAGGWLWGQFISKRIEIPRERYALGEADRGAERKLPGLGISLLPIIIPVVLVAGNTLTNAFLPGTAAARFFGTFGQAVVALAISVLVSYIMLGLKAGKSAGELFEMTERAIAIGAVCILITGAGGAFGGVLVECGIGSSITGLFSSTGISPIIFAYFMAVIFKTSQGSSATAMITVSAMLAPIITEMGLTVNPVYILTAIAAGSMTFSWMNDSGFWVIAKLCNMTEKESMKTVSMGSAIMSVVGLMMTLILSFIFPMV